MENIPSRQREAFSLIEVVFTIAIFSFSMLTVVGLMATGLSSASDSSRSTAMANIQRLLRANVSATTYTSITNTVSPAYFTAAGYPTVKNPVSAADNPYFSVSYTTNLPSGSIVGTGTGTVVRVSMGYPYPSNIRTNTFSLFVAP